MYKLASVPSDIRIKLSIEPSDPFINRIVKSASFEVVKIVVLTNSPFSGCEATFITPFLEYPITPSPDFEDYRKKVNRYVEEHKNDAVIYKLNHNQPLYKADYEELERILTQELGDSEDYKREYGDTPFGLLVRTIAKLDHDSAMAAFSAFINDSSLNQKQIEFILKIINHIENNGYIEDVKILMKPPFDKPYSFIKMFDPQTRTAILQTIESIKNNALTISA